MLFNSYIFIFLYLPIALLVFFFLGKNNPKKAAIWLAIISCFFYGWWNIYYLLLLFFSIGMNYQFGKWILDFKGQQQGSYLLMLAIVLNFLLLIIFKYANFFIEISNSLGGHFSTLQIILPLGISFFTFTQIAYLVDIKKGLVSEKNFIHYVLFVTWFPHLIAGPILHHQQMMPQFEKKSTYKPNVISLALGLSYFTIGLFKKVVIADQFALYANPIFDAAAQGTQPLFFEAWIGALAYSLQLYFDFSGYSDMAIGLSKLFNIDLPLNFNAPYKADSIIDFWRRWHISLSSFLRDYLYIPLGGGRHGVGRKYMALLVTMLLGGLWHGAGWKFLLWGALHGFYLILNHLWRFFKARSQNNRIDSNFKHARNVIFTFIIVVITWVPFRADNLSSCINILSIMFGFNCISLPFSLSKITIIFPQLSHFIIFNGFTSGILEDSIKGLTWIFIGLLLIWGFPNTQQLFYQYSPFSKESNITFLTWNAKAYQGIILGSMLAFSILNIAKNSPFLYFQF
jgi:alginate O-acetyltransferase complex protein AlgI